MSDRNPLHDRTVHSIAVGLTRTVGTRGETTSVGEVRWRAPDLPGHAPFVEAVERLYAKVELPSFPASAWVDVETAFAVPRCEIAEAVRYPEEVANVLWAFVQDRLADLA